MYDAYLTAFAALTLGRSEDADVVADRHVAAVHRPARTHMFLKPTSMRNAAAGLGVDLEFKSAPNWPTYERMLAFSKDLLEFIKPRSGEDMIDVQAFIAALVE